MTPRWDIPKPYQVSRAHTNLAGDLLTAWKEPTSRVLRGATERFSTRILLVAAGAAFLSMCERLNVNPWTALCSVEGVLLTDPPRPTLRLTRT